MWDINDVDRVIYLYGLHFGRLYQTNQPGPKCPSPEEVNKGYNKVHV